MFKRKEQPFCEYHYRYFLSLLFFVVFGSVSFAQTIEERILGLEKLKEEVLTQTEGQRKRVAEYSQRKGIPIISYNDFGDPIVLVDVTEAGEPQFMTIHNSGASLTTGVDKLRTGGGLGLSIDGEGMVVGVWDGGSISPHIEFGDRLLQTEGSQVSDHAAHVTGTIISAGIANASSRGMAPKAQARTWDFSNDLSEMITQSRADQSTLLLSNHSYGLIMGWRFDSGTWQWFGNASISQDEDYRFGFYSNNARQWDQLALNAPYYTMVKSAGNDRNDTGNGTRPPDCNGGEGYDCLGDISNSKNIIVVGAVNKVTNYTGPSSVQMSAFSSWGPTDDGRIKPDLVGAGVSIFSTISNGTNNYGVLSGTSMAAPNVTGSLLLLQELNNNLTGNYLRSATLKALAIHTAKEAGDNPGPDYKFGWGLLDVEAAAKVLLNNDNINIIVTEENLFNDEVYEVSINPVANTKVTVTIAWTDPPGNPVAAALDPTDLMLVNDLDIRIVDDANNEIHPWILDPVSPSLAAIRGDNFRDNVEKIEFDNPDPRPYRIRVTHKGQLLNGQQSFSLIITYTSANDQGVAYYWVGGSGNWNDPLHWSLMSGGSPVNQVPTLGDRIFFDENSFTASDGIITLDDDAVVSSVVWLATRPVSLNLNNKKLRVDGNFNLTSNSLSVSGPGKLIFSGSQLSENQIGFRGNDFSNADIEFDGAGSWNIQGSANLGKVSLISGELRIVDQQLTVEEFVSTINNSRTLNLSNSIFSGVRRFELNSQGLGFVSDGLYINSTLLESVEIGLINTIFKGTLNLVGENLMIYGPAEIDRLLIDGNVKFFGNNKINHLKVKQGSTLLVEPSTIQFLSDDFMVTSNSEAPVTLGTFNLGNAKLKFEGHFKLCFDHLSVTNLDVEGSAVVNAGLNSIIVNSLNWLKQACEDVLFPNFSFNYNCVDGLVEFKDLSEGLITSWLWDLGNGAVSTLQNPYYTYTAVGDYNVTLVVSNSESSVSFDRVIQIKENPLPANYVVFGNNRFFSVASAPFYQWFRDGNPITGAVERSYPYEGESGIYFVVTRDGSCSRVSTPYVITSLSEGTSHFLNDEMDVRVYPNPTHENIHVELSSIFKKAEVRLLDSYGRLIYYVVSPSGELTIPIENIASGIYILSVNEGRNTIRKKVIVHR